MSGTEATICKAGNPGPGDDGETLAPDQAETALLEHPGIAEAAVFCTTHPRLGRTLAAAVVCKPGHEFSEAALLEFLRLRLRDSVQPSRITELARLPRDRSGRVSRTGVSDSCLRAQKTFAGPQQLLEFELLSIWKRTLGPGAGAIGLDDEFFDLGGDSLQAVNMLLEVEALSGKPYPDLELSRVTIRRMAHVLWAGFGGEPEPVLTVANAGSGPPFFFCHGDGATRGLYAHQVARMLPRDQPVFLLHAKPESYAGVEDIAAAYLPKVVEAAAGLPVIVGGYCNGGLSAWHLASMLRASRVPVLQLVLLETPSLNAGRAMRGLAGVVGRGGSAAHNEVVRRVCLETMRSAWRLNRNGFARSAALCVVRSGAAIRDRFRGGPLQGRGDSRADAGKFLDRIMASYVPPQLDVGVTCLVSREGRSQITRSARWANCAPRVSEVSIPGDHHTCVVAHRPALASALTGVIEKARREGECVPVAATPFNAAAGGLTT